MRRVNLLVLTALVLTAFGLVGTSVASAEDGSPAILCLVTGCTGFEVTATGKEAFLETLSGKGLAQSATGKVTASIKNCKEISGSGGKDINLCEPALIEFTEVIIKGTTSKCNSEGDAAGVVLAKLDLHLASEQTLPARELQPLLLAKVAEKLKLSCAGGLIKAEVLGTVGCLLLPGLLNVSTGEELTLKCEINTTSHDPITGDCEMLCEWLTNEAFAANLGAGEEDAWMNIHVQGKPNKDIFIDD